MPFIEATPAGAILERPVVDRAPIKNWGFLDGRLLLIGDAVRFGLGRGGGIDVSFMSLIDFCVYVYTPKQAHAMILSVGQGANTALEDAGAYTNQPSVPQHTHCL